MPRFGFRNSCQRRRKRPERLQRTRRTPSCAMTRLQDESRSNLAVKNTNGIRHELVARVRQEILAGTYDTPAKMELALERLLSHLATD